MTQRDIYQMLINAIHTCTPPVVGFGKVLGTHGVVESWPDIGKEVK
jgi:hypothetical protein